MIHRKLFGSPSPDVLRSAPDPLFELDIDVVTPMFGGSAKVRTVDPEHPVSGKSVRGHLRFWWRACNAPRYPSAAMLFEAESLIWGSTDQPSAVDIQVTTINGGREVECATYVRRPNGKLALEFEKGYPPYALFPFQGSNKGGEKEDPATALEDVKFHLTVVTGRGGTLSQAHKTEVEGALWAWILFGGVGSRTRRGCGSLWTSNARFQYAPGTFVSSAKSLVKPGAPNYGVPVLSGASLTVGSVAGNVPSWNESVDSYQAFRQGPGFARNPGQQRTRPGRSRWPEPDSIRDRAGRNDPDHSPEHRSRPFYPRADLGLPIVFHFQSKSDPNENLTLEAKGVGASRMASPVITKSLSVSATQGYPIVLLLAAPHVWDSVSGGVGFESRGSLNSSELNDATKARYVRPLNDMGATTAREAFKVFVENKWQVKEIKL